MRWLEIDKAIEERVDSVALSWKGTPYMPGQQVKGLGVDCVRFVCAVLDELYGYKTTLLEHMPYDMCMHHPAGAKKVMRKMLSKYKHTLLPKLTRIEPGDILMIGRNNAPGHAMIAGSRNRLWHQSGKVVCMTAPVFPGWKPVKICRPSNKEDWKCHS